MMLDVGQGDAFYVQSKGQSLLVDTGNQDGMLLEGIAKLHVAHIDNVLLTHADDDHCGSLDAIARAVDVDRVIVSEGMLHDNDAKCEDVISNAGKAAHEVVSLSYGDEFSIGSIQARVVWPQAYVEGGANANSLCLSLSYDGDEDGRPDFYALFTGDAEHDELAKIISSGDVSKVDLLKVGHHGSKNGMTLQEAEALAPRIALIGVGENNRYGHPSSEILAMLDEIGCTVYRSDVDGEVRCMLFPDGVRVSVLG